MYQNRHNKPWEDENPSTQWDLIIESTNRWVKLAQTVPWAALIEKYGPALFAIAPERSAEQVRMLLGALIIKEKYGFTDQETLDQISENPYLQYFIGLKEFSGELPFDAVLLAEFQHQLDRQSLDEMKSWSSAADEQKRNPSVATVSTPEQVLPTDDLETPGHWGEDFLDTIDAAETDDSLEKTLEMLAIAETEPWNYQKSRFRQGCNRLGLFFSRALQAINGSIENWKITFEDKLAELLNARPEIMHWPGKLRRRLLKVGHYLQQAFKHISWHETVWFRYTIIFILFFWLGLVLLLIYLPVPPPRMLAASEVYDTKNRLAATFFSENRRPVKLAEVPQFLRQAVLAVEDHRFYKHKGINLGRIFKAAWHDLLHGNMEQGGSTITQQLVKNVYLSHERTFSRKFLELLFSIKLEFKLSKDEIFELYLNKIYFGHGAYGVKVAAETYFQRELDKLNEAEMAMLAGLPRGPSYFSPYKHPKAARRRLLVCLQRMEKCGFITAEQYKRYSKQPLRLPGLKTRNNAAPYFMDLLQIEIARLFPENPQILYTAGLKIEATLDLELHQAALNAFNQGLPRVYQRKDGIPQPQGAFIVMDPQNGEIRVLIGGTDYSKSQFNRGTQAKRQPGSAFKPILYAAALGNGFTLASQFDRTPKTYYIGNSTYRPTDHHEGSGMLTLRQALAQSSNVVAVKLLEQVGFKSVFTTAEQLGIKSKLKPRLSLALGACEVTPLELATAYATLANGGTRYTPTTIRRILDRQGNVLYRNENKGKKVFDPAVAYLTTQAMMEVLKSGTAAGVGARLKHPAAGKTGTTNDNRDTWFVGYTPDLLACIFVGCDYYERSLPGMASQVTAPIWGDFMQQALAKYPVRDFPMPANIKKVSYCTASGLLAGSSCPSRVEYFIDGTEPNRTCERNHFRINWDELFGDPFDHKKEAKPAKEMPQIEKLKPHEEQHDNKNRLGEFFRRLIQKI